jgi:ABC-type dipeptide/oligopeptide/nickel transport system permease subunit
MRFNSFILSAFLLLIISLSLWVNRDIVCAIHSKGLLMNNVLYVSSYTKEPIKVSSIPALAEYENTLILLPVVPFDSESYDIEALDFKPPMYTPTISRSKGTHYLGTGKNGNDLLADILFGIQQSFFVGLCSTGIALFVAVCLLWIFFKGLYEPFSLSLRSIVGIFFFMAGIICLSSSSSTKYFYAFWLFVSWFLVISTIVLLKLNKKCLFEKGKVSLALTKGFNFFETIPKIFLLMIVVLMIPQSYFGLVMVIGLLQTVLIYKFLETETIKIKTQEYVSVALLISGHNYFRVFYRHIIPNLSETFKHSILLCFSGAVLLENTLSYIGLSPNLPYQSLGGIMDSGRENDAAWWIVVFPGIGILLLILAVKQLIEIGYKQCFDSNEQG